MSRVRESPSMAAGQRGRSQSRDQRESAQEVVDDLLQGMSEWRNIQDVIRSTFKALHDVIKAQGDAVSRLEAQVQGKTSYADTQAALQRKANITDVNRSILDIQHALEAKCSVAEVKDELSRKADAADLDAIQAQHQRQIQLLTDKNEELAQELDRRMTREEVLELLSYKVNSAEFEERVGPRGREGLSQVMSRKVERSEFESLAQELRSEFDHVAKHPSKVEKMVAERVDELHDRCAEIEGEIVERYREVEGKLESVVHETAALLSEQHASSRKEFRELAESWSASLKETNEGRHVSEHYLADQLARVEEALGSSIQNEIAHAKIEMEKRLAESLDHLEELLGMSARRDDVVRALSNKADKRECENALDEIKSTTERQHQVLMQQLASKASTGDMEGKVGYEALEESLGVQEQALQRVAEMVAGVQKEVKHVREDVGRRSATELKAAKDAVEEALGQIQGAKRELKLKADVKDINQILDAKADVDEVNRALLDLSAQMNQKASMADISATLQEQALLNSTLIAELCLGRWIWKSLKTKQGGLVPWNIQTANSDPANLVWERDKAHITCVMPGLYEVSFGFYSRRKPAVKLVVNSEPVLTLNGPPPGVGHHAGGRMLSSGRYTNSNVTGLTHMDYVALPAKARVALVYEGDDDAEAFLGLKKL